MSGTRPWSRWSRYSARNLLKASPRKTQHAVRTAFIALNAQNTACD